MSNRMYPRGKIRADDDGQLRIAVVVRDQTIVIDFGKPVAWIGFGIADAELFVTGIQDRINELKGRTS